LEDYERERERERGLYKADLRRDADVAATCSM